MSVVASLPLHTQTVFVGGNAPTGRDTVKQHRMMTPVNDPIGP